MREAIRGLALDPSGRARLLDVKPLEIGGRGSPLYRLRVGEWRAAFELRDRDVIILRVFARSEGYGWLDSFDL